MTAIRHAGLSDVGRVRTDNEDRWFADPSVGLYLVADGIGGCRAGGLAAQIVAEVLPRLLENDLLALDGPVTPAFAARVQAALTQLSQQLCQEGEATPGYKGIGSTVVLALVSGSQALVAHLGDSRAYRLRAGRLERLTKDHTIAQLLVDRGELTPDQAATHPGHGQLTRFVGMAGEATPDVKHIQLLAGDRLLLCTDGLTAMLSDSQISSLLLQWSPPAEACRQLIAAAREAGGKDNITALVVTLAGG